MDPSFTGDMVFKSTYILHIYFDFIAHWDRECPQTSWSVESCFGWDNCRTQRSKFAKPHWGMPRGQFRIALSFPKMRHNRLILCISPRRDIISCGASQNIAKGYFLRNVLCIVLNNYQQFHFIIGLIVLTEGFRRCHHDRQLNSNLRKKMVVRGGTSLPPSLTNPSARKTKAGT